MATGELNLERNGKMSGMKSLCADSGPKSGVGASGGYRDVTRRSIWSRVLWVG